MAEKKNIFGKVKDWWKSLSQEDRDAFKIAGIWFVDGIGVGMLCTAAKKNVQMNRAVKVAEAKGYLNGRMDSSREIVQDPYFQMNHGMSKLEKQGKAQKF